MKLNIVIKPLIILVAALFFGGCATAPMGEISSSANPSEEIEKLSADLDIAQEANVDVLARKDFKKSYGFLEKAKEDLVSGKDQEKIINDLRFARQSLKQAYSIAENRKERAPGLFEARQNAIKAGAAHSSELKEEWMDLDDDVADSADELNKVSTQDIAKFQARYMELEKKSVIEVQLGKARAQINGARNDGAKKSAPKTLRKAELSLKSAESLIGSNVSNPSGFKQAVVQASEDASILSEVVEAVKQNGRSLTEAAALRIVSQKRQITDLKKNLSTSEGAISDAESKLNQKEIALGAAQTSVAMQRAMEQSRQQFLSSEAEAYQQGGNLLIRLKSMNFPSGRAELPSQSIALLAKVSDVAKQLNAKEIKVEGHTDSIGTSELNKKLSEQRAGAVALYFKANGFEGTQVLSEGRGFESPIATNKSKEGRAQNRRVDIIITPEDDPAISQ